MPVFNGNLLHWQEFWDIFDSAVHQQDISNVTKFSYLKNALRGEAVSAVCGISVTNDNYLMVIRLLKEKFGNQQANVEALYFQLQYLPVAINRFAEIKQTYEAIEKILKGGGHAKIISIFFISIDSLSDILYDVFVCFLKKL